MPTPSKERYVEITIGCPRCEEELIIQVRARTGFAQMSDQTVTCPRCGVEFSTLVPDAIVGGPFIQDDEIALIVHCPQCPHVQQGTSMSLRSLKAALASDEAITMFGTQCGHTWPMSEQDREAYKVKFLDQEKPETARQKPTRYASDASSTPDVRRINAHALAEEK